MRKSSLVGILVGLCVLAAAVHMQFTGTNLPFELAVEPSTKKNWRLGTDQTVVAYVEQGLDLTTDRSRLRYQIVSDVIKVTAGEAYLVELRVNNKEGGLILGMLHVEENRWIAQWPVKGLGPAEYNWLVRTEAEKIALIVTTGNGSEEVSRAVLSRLTLNKAE